QMQGANPLVTAILAVAGGGFGPTDPAGHPVCVPSRPGPRLRFWGPLWPGEVPSPDSSSPPCRSLPAEGLPSVGHRTLVRPGSGGPPPPPPGRATTAPAGHPGYPKGRERVSGPDPASAPRPDETHPGAARSTTAAPRSAACG